MPMRALPRRRPVASAASVAFIVSFAVTVAYFAGAVPGVPKTLPTFADLVALTLGLFALAVLAWVLPPVLRRSESDPSE